MYYDLVLWLASLPSFIIYGLIAGVAGAFGTIAAEPFRNRFGNAARIVPIIFIVFSLQLTPRLILPKLETMAFEAGFMKAVGELPRRLDDVTIMKSAGVYDDALHYNYEITTDLDNIDFARETILDMLASSPDCKKVTSVPAKYASQAIFRYETNLGEISISLKPSDCR